MHPIRVHLAMFRPLFTIACLAILLSGCLAIPQAPASAPTAPVQAATPEAAQATHEAMMADPAAHATHEAQMLTPEAMATHEALMRTPGGMATHEAQMHGTPTPVPPVAASVALSDFVTDDFVGSGLCVMCHEAIGGFHGRGCVDHERLAQHHDGERGQGSGLAGQGGLGSGPQPGAERRHREEVRQVPHPDGRGAGGNAGRAGRSVC